MRAMFVNFARVDSTFRVLRMRSYSVTLAIITCYVFKHRVVCFESQCKGTTLALRSTNFWATFLYVLQHFF